MSTIENTVTETAHDMSHAVGERAKRCVDGGANAVNTVAGKARDIVGQADGCVRESPWMAVGIAAGVGLVAGILLGRHTK